MEKNREDFEKWWVIDHLEDCLDWVDGKYVMAETQSAWEGWCGARKPRLENGVSKDAHMWIGAS